MYGVWQISPISAREVVFGNVHSESSITAEFQRGATVDVEEDSYYWAIENGLLLLSTTPPHIGC